VGVRSAGAVLGAMVFRVPMSALSGALRGGMRRHGAAQVPASARAASSGGGSKKSAKRGAFVVTSGATAFGVYWFWRDTPAYTEAEKPSTLASAGLSRSVLAPITSATRGLPNPKNLFLTHLRTRTPPRVSTLHIPCVSPALTLPASQITVLPLFRICSEGTRNTLQRTPERARSGAERRRGGGRMHSVNITGWSFGSSEKIKLPSKHYPYIIVAHPRAVVTQSAINILQVFSPALPHSGCPTLLKFTSQGFGTNPSTMK